MASDDKCEAPWKIDKYLLEKRIANGAYGYIYGAINEKSGDPVVAKFTNALRKQQSLQGLMNEYKCLRLIKHPNIIRLLEGVLFSDTSDDAKGVSSMMLVLERCVCDLDDILQCSSSPLNGYHIRTITNHMFNALAYLENSMLIHCDVKPSNILLSYDGRMKLCDFGFAKPIYSQNSRRGYTLGYAAPEVLLNVQPLDYTVDSWSAGCVFAELLKGKCLFKGSKERIHIRKIFKLCGCFTEEGWAAFRLLVPETYKEYNAKFKPGDLSSHLRKFVDDPLAKQLLCRLLVTDRKHRWTCTQALESPYMQGPTMEDVKDLVKIMEEEIGKRK